jgi:class 3 adenylate cyclase
MVLLSAARECHMQDEAGTPRPSGTVTFLFSDVEGSTRLWAADVDAMSASLLVHDEILRSAIESRGGYVFTTAGDSFAARSGGRPMLLQLPERRNSRWRVRSGPARCCGFGWVCIWVRPRSAVATISVRW